ncbi:MAG: DUF1653 domain-containing protein [Magnetococcus sp. YQC-3]
MIRITPGEYKHIKTGNIYNVMQVVRNANNPYQMMVVYKSTVNSDFPAGTTWVRPYDEFMGKFEIASSK